MTTPTAERASWVQFLTLLVSCFVTIEAAAFQAPAVPRIASYFGISASTSAFIMLLYFMALIAFSPIFGRIADRYGRKRVMVCGLLAYSATELLAALAISFPMLLLARFLQGMAVACVVPVMLSFAAYLFPAERRGMAMGLLAFSMSAGAATGAAIGGILVDQWGWRSIYWVSSGLALVGALLVSWKVRETPLNLEPFRLNWVGVALLLVGVGSALTAPSLISRFGWLSPQALGAFAAAATGFVLLWTTQRRATSPLIDVTVLRQRNFFLPAIMVQFFMICSACSLYSLTFFVNDRPGGSAADGGLIGLAAGVAGMLAALLSGKLLSRHSERSVLIGTVLLMFGAVALFSRIDTDTPLWLIAATVMLFGFGQGMKTPAVTKLALSAVPTARISAGSGLFSMIRDLGMPTGVTVGLALYSSTLASQTQRRLGDALLAAGIDPSLVADLGPAAPHGQLAARLQEELAGGDRSLAQLLQTAEAAAMGGALSQIAMILLGLLVCLLLLALALPGRRTGGAQPLAVAH